MIEQRRLGRGGPRVGVIGVCTPDESVAARALQLGCTLRWTGAAPPGAGLVKYNLLDQKTANEEISGLRRAGQGVIAVHVLAGGALAGRADARLAHRVEALRVLVKPGRTLVQAAIQFVLANESVDAAMLRLSTPEHLEEAVAALEAPPLTGQDLEQIFELWANRFE